MIAGLPKLHLLLAAILLSGISLVSFAQEIQTPSVVLEETIEIVWSNDAISPDQATAVADQILAAVEADAVTPEEVLSMLEDQLGWSEISDPERLALVIEALDQVLVGLVEGEIASGDAADALTETWIDLATPDGVINAIEKAAAQAFEGDVPEDLMVEVGELIADGVPPGIVLRVTKDALRSGEDPLEFLDALVNTGEESSWGQAANAATGQGQNKYQEQELEENANENQTALDEPEAEQEENANDHGRNPGNGNGSSGNNGNGNNTDKNNNGNGNKKN